MRLNCYKLRSSQIVKPRERGPSLVYRLSLGSSKSRSIVSKFCISSYQVISISVYVCVASTVEIGISPLNSPMNYLGIVTYFAWTWAAAAFQWQRGSAIRFIGQMMEQQVDRCRCRYGLYTIYGCAYAGYIWLELCMSCFTFNFNFNFDFDLQFLVSFFSSFRFSFARCCGGFWRFI